MNLGGIDEWETDESERKVLAVQVAQ